MTTAQRLKHKLHKYISIHINTQFIFYTVIFLLTFIRNIKYLQTFSLFFFIDLYILKPTV